MDLGYSPQVVALQRVPVLVAEVTLLEGPDELGELLLHRLVGGGLGVLRLGEVVREEDPGVVKSVHFQLCNLPT